MEIKLMIDASPKLLEVLTTLAGAIAPTPKESPVVDMSSKPRKQAAEKPETAKPAEETAKVITLEQCRELVVEKNKAGKKAELQNIFKEFGVNRLTEVAKEHYPELYQKVAAL